MEGRARVTRQKTPLIDWSLKLAREIELGVDNPARGL
jgi:hypothetical protein